MRGTAPFEDFIIMVPAAHAIARATVAPLALISRIRTVCALMAIGAALHIAPSLVWGIMRDTAPFEDFIIMVPAAHTIARATVAPLALISRIRAVCALMAIGA